MSAPERISQLSTSWTLLRKAHDGSSDEAALARELLIERYLPAVRRYLAGLLNNDQVLDDLTQEFALAMVQGRFRRADPDRGRFRAYLKTTLSHLVKRYRRREGNQPILLAAEERLLEQVPAPEQADTDFDTAWRDHLLARTWAVLQEIHPRYHRILSARAEHPECGSERLAERLNAESADTLTADGIRQALRRARQMFSELLVEEMARSLDEPTQERLVEELQVLGLYEQCKDALGRR